eukprot:GILK01006710.1.p1 GENE.GILK01006710.1~~GILK01006710.1.p1  ORF type:complete len:699 (+),score=120.13 GILK01006710.1:35-2131(+)
MTTGQVVQDDRGTAWQTVFNVNARFAEMEWTSAQERFAGQILANQDVIRADVDRTHVHHAVFQDDASKQDLELMLTLYCLHHNVSYKQGMHEVLAPLFLLSPALPLPVIYQLYSHIIQRFLPRMFADELVSLQKSFPLFRQLLQYHEPSLSALLDRNFIIPDLYAFPWFLTLFGSTFQDVDVLFKLWDALFETGDIVSVHFFSLAFVLHHRDLIIAADGPTLPETISKLPPPTPAMIDQLVAQATVYRSRTPQSWVKQLESVLVNECEPSTEAELAALSLCMEVDPAEYIVACEWAANDRDLLLIDKPIRFILVDCRPIEQFMTGHPLRAVHLDPNLYEQDIEAWHRGASDILSIARSIEAHIVVLSESADDPYLSLTVLHLLESNAVCLSKATAGYVGFHEWAFRISDRSVSSVIANVDFMAGHDAGGCLVCSPPQESSNFKHKATQLLASIRANPKVAAFSRNAERRRQEYADMWQTIRKNQLHNLQMFSEEFSKKLSTNMQALWKGVNKNVTTMKNSKQMQAFSAKTAEVSAKTAEMTRRATSWLSNKFKAALTTNPRRHTAASSAANAAQDGSSEHHTCVVYAMAAQRDVLLQYSIPKPIRDVTVSDVVKAFPNEGVFSFKFKIDSDANDEWVALSDEEGAVPQVNGVVKCLVVPEGESQSLLSDAYEDEDEVDRTSRSYPAQQVVSPPLNLLD